MKKVKRKALKKTAAMLMAGALCGNLLPSTVSAQEGGWRTEGGAEFWYENGIRQGTEGRGREIYDPGSDSWYWLDSIQQGAKAAGKDVYLESNGGKWARYDENGHMVRGEDVKNGLWYYFDPLTGAMAKGPAVLPDGRKCLYDFKTGQMVKGRYTNAGKEFYFDETDGHFVSGAEGNYWLEGEDGRYYWYENWSRQGFDPFDQSYRGREIHDPDSDSWYWLDNVQQGARAVNKDVYQESLAGEWGDSTDEDGQKTGKWVRYDENGQMVKGWDEKDGHKYYFDPVYGTMAKGDAVIDGESYYFDETTGILTDRSQEPTQTPDVTEKPVSPDVTEKPVSPDVTEEPDTPDVPEFDYSDVIRKDGEDDVTAMTLEEWVAYENHMDYAEIFTNITSYTHEDLRAMLDMHWSHLLQFPTAANGFFDPLEGDREAQFGLLKEWHNFRVQMQPTQDAEAARIYLWPEGQVPTITEYTENPDYAYADAPDFEPFMLESLLPEGTTPKGAVLISPGGGHNYRSNVEESLEVAMALNEEGYQCFIVNYRVEPYSDAESALDIARAVRIVRSRAAQYGISEDNIALAGFSYGGIVGSLAADRYAGDVNASAVVSGYVPDAIDGVSADINAYLAIYSVTPCAYTPNTYPEITNPDFPPTFFGVGDADNVRFWAQSSYEECQSKGIKSEYHEFTGGVPHGFGAGIHADGTAYPEAQKWPSMADDFMQEVYADAGISAYEEGMISEEAAVEVPETVAAEEPEAAAEEPEAVAEEPEAVAEESEAVAEESETVTEEPEAAAADAVAGDSPEGESLVPAAE